MIQAVETYGVVKGIRMGMTRVSRCHPFNDKHWHETNGYDPIPEKNKITNPKETR
jgi:putative component of membrane protein insertase Oxa1/YidC/SpoIIIJ protein YidD